MTTKTLTAISDFFRDAEMAIREINNRHGDAELKSLTNSLEAAQGAIEGEIALLQGDKVSSHFDPWTAAELPGKILLLAKNEKARDWLLTNFPSSYGHAYYGTSLVVTPTQAEQILDDAEDYLKTTRASWIGKE